MDELSIKFKKPRVNDVIEGEVVRVTDDQVSLDINYICEATIHRDQFTPESKPLADLVHVGDKVKAVVKKVEDGEEYTYVLMSRLPLIKEEKFVDIRKAHTNHETIVASVVKAVNKGVVLTYLGYELFMPDGQIALTDESVDKEALKGQKLAVKITEIDPKNRVFCSHRSVLWEEFKAKRAEELAAINVGDILTGTVSEIKPYGALVKFVYNQGLLRIGNICHTHIAHVEDVLHLGDKVEVKVINKEENKIDISMKALQKTPYELYEEAHKVSDTVTGKVIQKLPFGLILELGKDVTGLLHKNEFSWNPNDNFDSFVKIGDEVTAAILKMDVKGKKISLSKKALEDNPWARVNAKVGDLTDAKIEKIIAGKGVEVLAYGVTAFIPISELSNKNRVNRIEDMFAVGDIVKGRVIEVNRNEWILKISVKKLEAEIERKQFEEYSQEDAPQMTLGDRFKDILKK